MLGVRLAGAFFATGFFTVPLVAVALALDRAAGFFFAAGFFVVVTAAPDATRDECLVRCLVVFFVAVAASAIDVMVKAAISATRSSFIVLRTIRLSSRPVRVDGCSGYHNTVPMDSLSDVRVAIYDAVVAGRKPSAADVARAAGLNVLAVTDAFRALADAHVIVLQPGTGEIAWAPPFSVIPTPFRVHAGDSSWYAPCAWDAFGIPAALKRDADIDARCAWSGETVPCGVTNGQAYGDAVIHLLVPAAHFWDDIAFT